MDIINTQILKSDITSEEHQDYYNRYLDLLPEDLNFNTCLTSSKIAEVFGKLTAAQYNFRYAENKWTPKQILQHITDVERLFSVRALRFSRGDTTEIPGFDINAFADADNSEDLSLSELINDYQTSRASTISLFKSFAEASFNNIGMASGGPFSVRVIPFILKGHETHHISILNEKYLKV